MNNYRNNPFLTYNYTVDYTINNLKLSIINLIKELIFNNKNINENNFEVIHLTGGNTNILYRVYLKNINELNEFNDEIKENNENIIENIDINQQYIVRLYGLGTEDFIDRKMENIIFAELSKSKISPPFLGLFNNGRVEGYLNARSLDPDEFALLPIGRAIAKAMANLQSISIDIDKNVGLWNKLHVFFSLAQGIFLF